MSPEKIVPIETAKSLTDKLVNEGYEVHNVRIFRNPDSKTFVAIGDKGEVISDSIETLNSLISGETIDPQLAEIAGRSIYETSLGTRYLRALAKSGFSKVGDLMEVAKSDDAYEDFHAIRNFGDKSIQRVVEELVRLGIPLTYFGDSLTPNLVKFLPREILLNSGVSQIRIDRAIAENTKPKNENMVRQRKIVTPAPKEAVAIPQKQRKMGDILRSLIKRKN